MEHIKLFEQFISSGSGMGSSGSGMGDIHLGFYADGGYGSHPGVITSEMSDILDQDKLFFTTDIVKEVPEALACMLDENMGEWVIKGITNSLANSIIKRMGGDHITTDQISTYPGEEGAIEDALRMAGIEMFPNYDIVSFSVIPNVSLDMIYWSDAPENEHVSWEPPYEAINAKELMERYK
jgi:hypothetical protein